MEIEYFEAETMKELCEKVKEWMKGHRYKKVQTLTIEKETRGEGEVYCCIVSLTLEGR